MILKRNRNDHYENDYDDGYDWNCDENHYCGNGNDYLNEIWNGNMNLDDRTFN